jgi:hypothetical protein
MGNREDGAALRAHGRGASGGVRQQHGKSRVESTTGAVVVDTSQLLPPLSFGGVAIEAS